MSELPFDDSEFSGFRLALEASAAGMLLVDDAGTIVFANQLAERLFGAQPGGLSGRSVDELVPAHVAGVHAQYRQHFLDDPSRRAMGTGRDLQAVRLDGALFPVEIGLNPFERNGRTWVLGSSVDITRRVQLSEANRAAQQQALEAQRLESLGLLAGGVAHDFNNLLVAVLGNSKLALSMAVRKDVAECIEDVVLAAEQASGLARQMLAYSGRGRFLVEELDLAELVTELVPLLQATVHKRIDIRVRTSDPIPPISADSAQLRQVVLNLVNNAADAIDKSQSGSIQLAVGAVQADEHYLRHAFPKGLEPGSYAYLEVSDTGTGMDEDTRRHIFDPFFTTKAQGHGLGLAATLGILRSHRGGMVVYSEPRQGTTMKALFPVPGPEPVADAETLAPQVEGVILVADDEPMVRRFVKRALESQGYEVLEATDGMEAIQLFREVGERVDAVLLDMSMPNTGGADAFRAIRQVREDVPVILTSGFSKEEITIQFAGKRLTAFLQKPFTGDQLFDVISDAVNDTGEFRPLNR